MLPFRDRKKFKFFSRRVGNSHYHLLGLTPRTAPSRTSPSTRNFRIILPLLLNFIFNHYSIPGWRGVCSKRLLKERRNITENVRYSNSVINRRWQDTGLVWWIKECNAEPSVTVANLIAHGTSRNAMRDEILPYLAESPSTPAPTDPLTTTRPWPPVHT